MEAERKCGQEKFCGQRRKSMGIKKDRDVQISTPKVNQGRWREEEGKERRGRGSPGRRKVE